MSMKIGFMKGERGNQQFPEENNQERLNWMIWNSKSKKSLIWQKLTKITKRSLLELMGIQIQIIFYRIWLIS